jgi:hypothetical protein
MIDNVSNVPFSGEGPPPDILFVHGGNNTL